MDTVQMAVDARGVAVVTLSRSEKRNALSAQMMDELTAVAQACDADPAVRVVVLAAEGDVFCAGGDLGWMREQMAADAAARTREARRLADDVAAAQYIVQAAHWAGAGRCVRGRRGDDLRL